MALGITPMLFDDSSSSGHSFEKLTSFLLFSFSLLFP